MKKPNAVARLETSGAEDLAEETIKHPNLLSDIFNGVSSSNPKIKFKSAKTLVILSKKDPQRLYPRFDYFVNLLDSENNILKWNAMDAIANLASVDSENKFETVFEKFYRLLESESLITVGHVIDNSGKIAKAKPNYTGRITNELLETEGIQTKPHLTQECKNILLGKAIVVLGTYFDQIDNKDEVISFVKRQLTNTRNATKLKAEKFLNKIK